MPYKVQDGQIVESVEMKQVLRVHYRKTFVIDETACPEDVESKMLVGVRSALAVPFLADHG